MRQITLAIAIAALMTFTATISAEAQNIGTTQSTVSTNGACQLPTGRKMQPVKQSPAFKVVLGKVNYKEDVTRVELSILGMPHTSCRIDSVSLTLPSGKEIKATDIDPIDFERYFQWEDEGNIDLEIDFPAGTRLKKGSVMKFATSKGEVTYTIKK